MKILMIQKIDQAGKPCRKCAEILRRIERDGYRDRIHGIITADERDPEGEGMRLARRHGVFVAPFFIVQPAADAASIVYTSYLKLARELFRAQVGIEEESRELLDRNPDLLL